MSWSRAIVWAVGLAACADESPTGAEGVAAATVEEDLPPVACTVLDTWHDLSDAPSMEELRGYDDAGRPLWHAVDGELVTTWSYDEAGQPLTMQQGDPLDPQEEHVYFWADDGRLESLRYGDGRRARFAFDDDGRLLDRTVEDSDGTVVERVQWSIVDGVIASWELSEGGAPTLRGERDTYDDGLGYLEVQSDLRAGSWLELLELFHPDGSPDMVSVTTDQGHVTHTWLPATDGWRLLARWATTGAELRTLDDEVAYRFDEQGREVERTVVGEGASPFLRRVRTWGCERRVSDPFVPPDLRRPSFFYVSPLYVDPPPFGGTLGG